MEGENHFLPPPRKIFVASRKNILPTWGDVIATKESENSLILVFARKVLAVKESGVAIALILIILFFSLTCKPFLTTFNLLNLMRQMSITGIVAIGVTLLMVSGEFDLSVGSVFAVSGVTVALLARNFGINLWFAALAGLSIAAFLGLINGLIVTVTKIPSFLATLGTMMAYRGLALILSGGWPVADLPPSNFYLITGGKILDIIPTPGIWVVIFCFIFCIVLNHTGYGNQAYATGGNEEAARLSGINTNKVKLINFVLTGIAAGTAALISLGLLQSAVPVQGQGMELEAIAAAVIGGTSLAGGSGTILGTLLGAIIMGMVRNGLVLLGASAYYQNALLGMVLVVAVIINTQFERRR